MREAGRGPAGKLEYSERLAFLTPIVFGDTEVVRGMSKIFVGRWGSWHTAALETIHCICNGNVSSALERFFNVSIDLDNERFGVEVFDMN